MIHFDSTVTAGSLISATIIIAVGTAGWVAFRARVDAWMSNQEKLLDQITDRFESHQNHDEQMFEKMQGKIGDLAAGVQRLVGQNDAFRSMADRRKD